MLTLFVVDKAMTLIRDPSLHSDDPFGGNTCTHSHAQGCFESLGPPRRYLPPPHIVGYSATKSAAHHYLQSWGTPAMDQNDVHAVGILSLMIDTPPTATCVGKDERCTKIVKPAHIARKIGE